VSIAQLVGQCIIICRGRGSKKINVHGGIYRIPYIVLKTGPAGRIGPTVNRRGHRFDWHIGSVMQSNRCEPAWTGQTRLKPVNRRFNEPTGLQSFFYWTIILHNKKLKTGTAGDRTGALAVTNSTKALNITAALLIVVINCWFILIIYYFKIPYTKTTSF